MSLLPPRPVDRCSVTDDVNAGGGELGSRLPAARSELSLVCRLLGHELRTPLALIIANSELVLDGAVGGASAGVHAAIADVAAAARRLEAVARALRQLETAAFTTRSRSSPVDLAIACREAGIGGFEMVNPAPVVHADPERVDAALRAAAAWMRAGAVTVRVLATISAGSAGKNTFGGIALDLVPPTHDRDDLGGLDLLLCRLLVAADGGDVHRTPVGLSLRWPSDGDRVACGPCPGCGFSA